MTRIHNNTEYTVVGRVFSYDRFQKPVHVLVLDARQLFTNETRRLEVEALSLKDYIKSIGGN